MICIHHFALCNRCKGTILSVLSQSKHKSYSTEHQTVPIHLGSGDDAKVLRSLPIARDAARRLSLIMERAFKGSNDVISSPFIKERSPDSILSGLDDIFNARKPILNDVLVELEMNNRSKYGPMSIALSWGDRKETLYDSYKSQVNIKQFNTFSLGVLNRLRPLSGPAAVGCLKNTSNSGFPDLTKKKNVKDLYLGYTLEDFFSAVSNFLRDMRTVKYENWKDFLVCVLFTRTQENKKTRNVWGYPILVTIFEMMFYRPLLEIQSKQTWRSALRKPDDVSIAVTKLIDYCLANDLKILSIDFSRYDNSVKKTLISGAFTIIKSAFQNQYSKYLQCISDYMIECPIFCPDGILFGSHGIPSGSTFTNEVDSIVQYGISLDSNCIANHPLSQVQGDDGLYAVTSADAVMDHFTSYGLSVNRDKSYVAENWGVYLQSLYHSDYRDENGIINGVYPIYRALNRIIHLERFDDFSEYGIDGEDYFSIRTISILENCKYHPLFKEFVTYIHSLDKYNLKFSDHGLANYVRKLAIQEGKDITFRNWSYGSDTAGLKTFESVKIINQLNSRVK